MSCAGGLLTHIINNWNNLSGLDRNFSQRECVSPWGQSKESLCSFQKIENSPEAAAIHSAAEDSCGMDGEWPSSYKNIPCSNKWLQWGISGSSNGIFVVRRSSNGKCYTYTYQRVLRKKWCQMGEAATFNQVHTYVIVYFLSNDVIILPVTGYACSRYRS